MDKNIKPQVFPTKEQMDAINLEKENLARFEAEKKQATNEVYINSMTASESNSTVPTGQVEATELMRRRTEEQMKLRDEQLKKNLANTENFQQLTENASNRRFTPPVTPPVTPPINNGYGDNYGQNPSNINPYIIELSQPNYNAPFDVIPLPSEGKLYRTKKANIRVGFMTTADENILTSPNLLQSGEFLEILINRKILEPELRYKDLHVGDRNAIMIWLRATSYGEMYPVTLLDEKNIPFDTNINLDDLKTKKLGAEPDAEGLFDFHLPLCKAMIKFKLLTCGDIDAIERMVDSDKAKNIPVNSSNTYSLERSIIEVNGSRDRSVIRDFANSIRVGDAKKLTEYVSKIESGIDLDIEVGTPGGSSIKTFLPLNVNFFWPNINL